MKKIRPFVRNWFDWSIKQSVMGKKPKIIRGNLKGKIINDIWRFFDAEKEREDRKKKKQNKKKTINNNIIRNIMILVEQEKEEDYYEPNRVSNF